MKSNEIKEDIKRRIDIGELIGEFINLKRRGRHLLGLCPFHNEKTPSFNVNPDLGIYKCFGCGKSGDIFSFYMEYHSLGFVDALKALGKRAGIEVNLSGEPINKDEYEKTDNCFKALKASSEFYSRCLFMPEGKNALEYIHKREFSSDTLKEFKLGYAPDSYTALSAELSRAGFSKETLINAGLVGVNEENGSTYDRFRNRLIFPIQDFMGREIGFGARQLIDDKKQAKYINSPQSLVYDKSKTLYGIFQAKKAIKNDDLALLVEGYADVISLHQSEIKNVVASSGTALTKQQLELLARYTKNVCLVYDADSAGENATIKGLELALEEGFSVKLARLPKGDDPDSFVRSNGKDAFRAYIRDSQSFMEFLFQLTKATGFLDNPTGKSKFARRILGIIAKIPDRLTHDDYIAQLAGILDFSYTQIQTLYTEKNKLEHKHSNQYHESPAYHNAPPDDFDYSAVVEPEQEVSIKESLESMASEERLMIQLLIADKEALPVFLNKLHIEKSDFINPAAGEMFFSLIQLYLEKPDDAAPYINHEAFEQSEIDFLTELAMSGDKPSDNWKKVGKDVIHKDLNREIEELQLSLQYKRLQNEYTLISNKMKHAKELSEDELFEIMKESKKNKERQTRILKDLEMVRER